MDDPLETGEGSDTERLIQQAEALLKETDPYTQEPGKDKTNTEEPSGGGHPDDETEPLGTASGGSGGETPNPRPLERWMSEASDPPDALVTRVASLVLNTLRQQEEAVVHRPNPVPRQNGITDELSCYRCGDTESHLDQFTDVRVARLRLGDQGPQVGQYACRKCVRALDKAATYVSRQLNQIEVAWQNRVVEMLGDIAAQLRLLNETLRHSDARLSRPRRRERASDASASDMSSWDVGRRPGPGKKGGNRRR